MHNKIRPHQKKFLKNSKKSFCILKAANHVTTCFYLLHCLLWVRLYSLCLFIYFSFIWSLVFSYQVQHGIYIYIYIYMYLVTFSLCVCVCVCVCIYRERTFSNINNVYLKMVMFFLFQNFSRIEKEHCHGENSSLLK